MNQIILTKQTTRGQQVTISINDNYCHIATYKIALDGKPVEVGMSSLQPLSAAEIAKMPIAVSHHIGHVCLTADEAATVQAAWDNYMVTDSEQIRQRLMSARELLCDRILAAMEQWSSTKESEFDRTDGATDFEAVAAPHLARAEAARAELTVFDAAHPEIIAGITARKDADYARFLATD